MLGQHLHCPTEEFTMGASGDVTLPGAASTSDCLGGFLAQAGADPTQLQVSYDGNADAVSVTYSGYVIKLTKGGCKKELAAAPSGEYCGSVLGVAKGELKSVDSSHVEL